MYNKIIYISSILNFFVYNVCIMFDVSRDTYLNSMKTTSSVINILQFNKFGYLNFFH